jgi:SAM-dependent methyltransferase
MKLLDRLREFEASVGDRVLGISTLGLAVGAHPEAAARHLDSNWYQSKNFYLNWRFLRALQLTPEDVIFDVGCGAGRLLCVASLFGCRRCVGIELSPSLCALARQNVADLRIRRSEIEIRQSDAALADYSSGTVFLFCNPFGADTMRAVLERIHESVVEHPRSVRILYVHPYPEHQDVLREAKWLRLVAERRFLGNGDDPVCYYEHAAPDEAFVPMTSR